ncbi:MAG: hypothetical protein JWO63_1705, partial [Frankiales bacterium]|nr:hypothetical protein [Frankiales bacterium]
MLIASVPAGTVTLSCCGSGRFSAAAAGGGLVDSLVTGVDDAVELSDGSGVTDGPEVIEWLAPLVALLVGAGRYGSDQVAEMPGTRLGEPSADGLVVALAADVEPVELAAAVGSAPSGAALELALLVAVGPTESDAEVAWTGTEVLGPVAGAAVAGAGVVLGFGRADGLLDTLAADFAPARAAGVVAP